MHTEVYESWLFSKVTEIKVTQKYKDQKSVCGRGKACYRFWIPLFSESIGAKS